MDQSNSNIQALKTARRLVAAAASRTLGGAFRSPWDDALTALNRRIDAEPSNETANCRRLRHRYRRALKDIATSSFSSPEIMEAAEAALALPPPDCGTLPESDPTLAPLDQLRGKVLHRLSTWEDDKTKRGKYFRAAYRIVLYDITNTELSQNGEL